MGYVDGDFDLEIDLIDRRPVPPGENEKKFVTAERMNNIGRACADLRTAVQELQEDGGGITNGAPSGRLMLSDGTNAVASAITEGDVDGEHVIGTSNGVRWDILGPFGPEVDTGLQVVMTGTGHAAEAVAVVGYVTSMDYDLSINGSQHAIGGQFKANATISVPDGVEVLENIAVQGEASGGTRNYSWYSNTGVMRQKGDVQLAVDDSTPRYVVIGPVGGSLPSGGNMQVNLNFAVDPLKTVSLGNNVAPFFVVGSTSVNPKISLGSPTSEGMQLSTKNTVTSGSDCGIGVHVDTSVIGSARGGLRIYRGAGGSTQAGGFEVAGGNNSLVSGTAANDIVAYARQAGARFHIGTGSSPTVRTTVDDAGALTHNAAFLLSGVISPPALSVSQNNYAPAGLSGAQVIRQDVSTTDISITGLTGGASGRLLTIINISATAENTLTIAHQSSSSTAANRFALAGLTDLVIPAGGAQTFWYDGTSKRWRTWT